MKNILEVLIFVVIGVILLWFGYTLFLSMGIPAWGIGRMPRRRRRLKPPRGESRPGDPQTCPVCSAKLEDGSW